MRKQEYETTVSFMVTKAQRENLDIAAGIVGMRLSDLLRDIINNCVPEFTMSAEFAEECGLTNLIKAKSPTRTIIPYLAAYLKLEIRGHNTILTKNGEVTIDPAPPGGVVPILWAIQQLWDRVKDVEEEDESAEVKAGWPVDETKTDDAD